MSGRPRGARPARPTDDQIVHALLDAYRQGAFPMGEGRTGAVNFYRPDPRGVLPLPPPAGEPGEFHVPRTIERLLGRNRFELRCDTAFEAVVRACAEPRPPSEDDLAGLTEPGTWINETIVEWYSLLHRRGHAHSVEAWITATNSRGDAESRLVGGIYGVSIGAAFFGESMFHRSQPRLPSGERHPFDGTSAGQVCLVALARHLAASGFVLFDIQMVTSIVRRFGGHEIPLADYLDRLEKATAKPSRWKPLVPPNPTRCP